MPKGRLRVFFKKVQNASRQNAGLFYCTGWVGILQGTQGLWSVGDLTFVFISVGDLYSNLSPVTDRHSGLLLDRRHSGQTAVKQTPTPKRTHDRCQLFK